MGDTSKNLTELLFTIDAAKRASVKSITVVLPYYGYGRQDRKGGERINIGAKVMAKVLEDFGVNRILTIDLHSSQIEGFFDIPVEHLKGKTIFIPAIMNELLEIGALHKKSKMKFVGASPDAGGGKRTKSYTDELGWAKVSMDKTRDKANSVDKMELMGNVKGCDVWIFDDMGDTLGTVCKAAIKLKEEGAKSVRAVFTHGILSGKAFDNLDKTPDLEMVYISDTCPLKPPHAKIKVVSCVPVLEQAMLKIINEESLSEFNK